MLCSIGSYKLSVSLSCLASFKKDSNNHSLKKIYFFIDLFIENLSELVDKDFSVYCINKKFALNYNLLIESFLHSENFSSGNNLDAKLREFNLKVRFLFNIHDSKGFSASKEFVRDGSVILDRLLSGLKR